MRLIATGILFAALCAHAHASGGLACETEDASVTFALEGGATRGMGSPLFAFHAEAAIAAAGVPDDLRKTVFGREHVAQYWLDGEELRLHLYREREGDAPHGYVELVIETEADGDDIGYSGRYSLTVFDAGRSDAGEEPVTAEGQVACSAE